MFLFLMSNQFVNFSNYAKTKDNTYIEYYEGEDYEGEGYEGEGYFEGEEEDEGEESEVDGFASFHPNDPYMNINSGTEGIPTITGASMNAASHQFTFDSAFFNASPEANKSVHHIDNPLRDSHSIIAL
jgi:hypothetical protein